MIKLFADYSFLFYFISFVVMLCTTYSTALDIEHSKTKQTLRNLEVEKSWEFTFGKFFSWIYFSFKFCFLDIFLFFAKKPVSIFIYATTLFAMFCALKG